MQCLGFDAANGPTTRLKGSCICWHLSVCCSTMISPHITTQTPQHISRCLTLWVQRLLVAPLAWPEQDWGSSELVTVLPWTHLRKLLMKLPMQLLLKLLVQLMTEDLMALMGRRRLLVVWRQLGPPHAAHACPPALLVPSAQQGTPEWAAQPWSLMAPALACLLPASCIHTDLLQVQLELVVLLLVLPCFCSPHTMSS